MPIFIRLNSPLEPLRNWKPIEKPNGYTIAQFIESQGIDMTFQTVLIGHDAIPESDWSNVIPHSSRVVITPIVGYEGVIVLIVLLVVAIGLYFFMPTPSTLEMGEADPGYTLRGQRNQARLGEPIEKHYGRVRHYPSYMAKPFNRYRSGEQWFYALLCLGLGKYDIHNIKIEDTDISQFDEVEYQIYQPGEKVKLFPTNVQTSIEINSVEMFAPNEPNYASWFGPIVAASSGSLINRLEIDISLREGLYHTAKDGLESLTVDATFEYQKIDDNGSPLGSWTLFENFTRTLETNKAKHYTLSKDVDLARYQVRGRRTNTKEDDYRSKSTLTWEFLRAFCESDQDFGDVTLLAIKARATNNLNDSSKSAINVEMTSKVQIWNGSDWVLSASRNPVWHFVDVLRATYGKSLAKSFYNLGELTTLAAEIEASTIRFDGTFADRSNVWETLQTLTNIFHAVTVVNGGVISIVRDVPENIPMLGFDGNNIVEDSMSVKTVLENYGDNDGLEVEYTDPDSYKRKTVICLLGTDRGINLKQVKLLGCRSRNRAYQWGCRQRAVQIYQRENYTFETGLEGGTSRFGDLIAIQHETIPTEKDFVETSSGRLAPDALSVEAGVTVIALPFVPTFIGGETYRIAIRDDIGTVRGPYSCAPHNTNANKVVLAVLIDNADFLVPSGGESAVYWFGLTGQEFALAKVIKIEPVDDNERVRITAIPYDERIYQFDNIEAPPLSEQFEPAELPNLPMIEGLKVKPYSGNINEWQVIWKPALGATSYLIYISKDGVKFTLLDTVINANYIITRLPGFYYIKVQAIGKGAGPAANWSGNLTNYSVLPAKIAEITLVEPVEDMFKLTWPKENNAESYIVKVYHDISKVIYLGQKRVYTNRADFTRSLLLKFCNKQDLFFVRTFYFTVQAVNTLGTSPVSNVFELSKADPVIPTNRRYTKLAYNNYKLEWDGALNEGAYFNVYASYSSAFVPTGPGHSSFIKTTTKNEYTAYLPSAPNAYFRIEINDDWGDSTFWLSARTNITT